MWPLNEPKEARVQMLLSEVWGVESGSVSAKGATMVPIKCRIEWPYVALLVAIVLMIAAAAHLLSAWVAYVIFAVLWIGFAIWPKTHR
jgi:hypothetical protein